MKKQLLNERQIRKMMKFANIGALTNNFINKINENDMAVPDDDMVDEDLELEEAVHSLQEEEEEEDTGPDTTGAAAAEMQEMRKAKCNKKHESANAKVRK